MFVIDNSVIVTSLSQPSAKPDDVSRREAMKSPVLLPKEQYPQLNPLSEAVNSRGLTMELAQEAEGVRHPLTLMAAAGPGVMIFPRSLVAEELGNALSTAETSDSPIPRRFGLAWLKGGRLSPLAKSFRKFIRAGAPPPPPARRLPSLLGGVAPIVPDDVAGRVTRLRRDTAWRMRTST